MSDASRAAKKLVDVEFSGDTDMSDFVPWHDSTKWEHGKLYPLPHSSEAKFGGTTLWILGTEWGVYYLDPDQTNGDILSLAAGLTMIHACDVANEANNLLTLKGKP